MMWVRNRWTSRVLAAVLILSILPTLMVSSSRGSGGAQFGSYEEWLRAQLRIPADQAVERAIVDAVEAGADSFDAFIAIFLEAYAKAAPGESISQVFTDRDLSNDALISYLQRRYSQVVEAGILPRVYLTSFVQNPVIGKAGTSDAAIGAGTSAFSFLEAALPTLIESTILISLRTLSSARALGP